MRAGLATGAIDVVVFEIVAHGHNNRGPRARSGVLDGSRGRMK